MTDTILISKILAGMVGGIVAMSELIARYPDRPLAALRMPVAIAYVAFNIVVAEAAFLLASTQGWMFGLNGSDEGLILWTQVLISAAAGMVLLRSSIFRIRAGNEELAIGPAGLLDLSLNLLDRQLDTTIAQKRASVVAEVMHNVSYKKARTVLPRYVVALIQAPNSEDEDRLQRAITDLDRADIDDETKSYTLGLILLELAGERVLRRVVNDLRREITSDQGEEVNPPDLPIAGLGNGKPR
jgi:hypothetical protein